MGHSHVFSLFKIQSVEPINMWYKGHNDLAFPQLFKFNIAGFDLL